MLEASESSPLDRFRSKYVGRSRLKNELQMRYNRAAAGGDAVKGRTIGKVRQSLKLTVKNVWDFEEMMRRGLVSTEKQLQDTLLPSSPPRVTA